MRLAFHPSFLGARRGFVSAEHSHETRPGVYDVSSRCPQLSNYWATRCAASVARIFCHLLAVLLPMTAARASSLTDISGRQTARTFASADAVRVLGVLTL